MLAVAQVASMRETFMPSGGAGVAANTAQDRTTCSMLALRVGSGYAVLSERSWKR
jgi:hypothetical protein